MIKKYIIDDIKSLKFDIEAKCIIYLYGDLWAGKTTMTKHIINNLLWYNWDITSPTYTYYNCYSLELKDFTLEKKIRNNFKLQTPNSKFMIYHFDLYRLKNYDEFFAIWWEEIFDNNNWIIIVEWPEIIEAYYKPDLEIRLNKTDKEDEREIEIIKR